MTSVIKQTVVAAGLAVETSRSSNVHSLRPFSVVVKDEKRGSAEVVGTFSSIATAAHAHEQTVRKLMADAGQISPHHLQEETQHE